MKSGTNLRGAALDAFLEALPDDPYGLCPCGCREKYRHVLKDEQKATEHQEKFIKNYLAQFLTATPEQ